MAVAGFKVHHQIDTETPIAVIKPDGRRTDEMPSMTKSAIQAGGLTHAPLKNRIRASVIRFWRKYKWRL